jgi:hypothetical protein
MVIWKRPKNETYEQRKQRIFRPSQDNILVPIDFTRFTQGEGILELQ